MNSERVRLPGIIDAHVHLREPGSIQKEDFQTGSRAAIAGGFTTILDMPNNPEPTIDPAALEKKITLVGNKIYCDVGFHFGATVKSVEYAEEIKDRVFGLKIYMNHTTGTLLMEDKDKLAKVFSSWPTVKPIIVHAEGVTLDTAINLTNIYGKKLHVAHLSTSDDLERVKSAKEKGVNITCEVTPHHLFLTQDDIGRLNGFGLMKPELAQKKDKEALWRGITEGVVDMIATDHAPHTIEEKLSAKPFYGVPGLETSLPLMLTAVAEGRLSLSRLIELVSVNPRKIFNVMMEGDTYTEVDLAHSYLISTESLQTKCAWTPFDGMRVKGKVTKVVLRGKTVFNGESIVGGPEGKVVYPYS